MHHDLTHEVLMTLSVALAAGVLLIALAHAIKQSSIVFLLVGGFVLGPSVLGFVHPNSLGNAFPAIVSLAVAIILFEGGLTLDLHGYRSASSLIRRLLTIGVLTTWGVTTIAVMVIFGYPFPFSLLAASLIIVTGPTVIAPLLRRIGINSRLHHILYWEGVLIDPIGVFIAILVFEWIGGGSGEGVLAGFGLRVVTGLIVGLAGGVAVYRALIHKLIPENMVNGFTLASAVLIYGACEAIGHAFGFTEAGLMAVVVAGFTLGVLAPRELKQIREFKAQLTDVMIGFLFVLLSARLDLAQFREFGWRGALLVAAVIFVVRPLNVYLSALGLPLGWKERAFLSWVAPRGIVAASMASLFAMTLADRPDYGKQAAFLETFTYSIIIGTIVLQGLSANYLAQRLGLKAQAPSGWMIVGAHALGRKLAQFAKSEARIPVILVDLNPQLVVEARKQELPALVADARDTALIERIEFEGIGHLAALTDNENLNILLCERWGETFGKSNVRGWISKKLLPGQPKSDFEGALWPSLPKPSIVSAELLQSRATLSVISLPSEGGTVEGLPLAAAQNGTLLLTQGLPNPKSEASAPYPILSLVRHQSHLLRAMQENLIMQVQAETTSDLFRSMLEQAASVDTTVPIESTYDELVRREKVFPTTIGQGVAIPHVYCPNLSKTICILARVFPGLSMGQDDGIPVQLIFLLLSPPGDVRAHLAMLLEISALVSNESVRNLLITSAKSQDVLNEIRKYFSTGDKASNAS